MSYFFQKPAYILTSEVKPSREFLELKVKELEQELEQERSRSDSRKAEEWERKYNLLASDMSIPETTDIGAFNKKGLTVVGLAEWGKSLKHYQILGEVVIFLLLAVASLLVTGITVLVLNLKSPKIDQLYSFLLGAFSMSSFILSYINTKMGK